MSDACYECGGRLVVRAGPGRTFTTYGVTYELPADLAIPTCDDCGEEFYDEAAVEALEAAYKAALAAGSR